VHNQFIEAVAIGRNLRPDQVRAMADGSVFTGLQAKDLGLVDEIGNLQDSISLAAEMAGIEGEPKVIESRKRGSFMSFFENKFPGVLPRIAFPKAGISLQYLMAF
ncbi:MAG TPA: S49 family peptidase, partial [Nitrospiria bacterium]